MGTWDSVAGLERDREGRPGGVLVSSLRCSRPDVGTEGSHAFSGYGANDPRRRPRQVPLAQDCTCPFRQGTTSALASPGIMS
jgi:hypothetical protein